ncbi:hypothetical protein [Mucilaginibacter lappiensis]|uniref:Uncharacterized protein n=1 Tax=Mucilaginibacter lappiensis TaxID=354630 RepID=A0A841JML6_9SPHI|nr:hypothetical protein [Mucilaginibacter lappiensis]MBB6129978.1 hypothetical protein [Mucilaginibacter lappiensis]
MTKSDQVIHSFAIYEIKRATFKPYDFKWAKFHENNSDFVHLYPEIQLDVEENELIICSTVIDADNYSLLTTRRIVTKENDIENIGDMTSAIQNTPPLQFKLEKYNYVFGTLQLQNGTVFRYFIEAGKASMVIEYGIRTLIWSQQLTDSQMINLIRIWEKKRKAKL